MEYLKLNINPQTAPRMVYSDRYKKRPCVVKYFKYRDDLQKAVDNSHLEIDFEKLRLYFFIEMPKSWSKKKKKEKNYTSHTSTPDIDNLLKAFLDSLLKNDSFIHDITVSKVWCDVGHIEVKVLP